MRMTEGLRIWVAGALAAFIAVCGQAQDLKTLKDICQKNAEEIRSGFQPKFDALQQQYQKSLEALKNLAQKQGNFKTTKAAISEIDRFQKVKTLPPAPDENEIPEIKTFQIAYVKQFSKLETEMTASLGAMTAKYGQALDRLLKELTRAGKMEEATAVETELTKAQNAAKDFAEQLAAFKGPPVANAAPAAPWIPATMAAGKPVFNRNHPYLVIDLSHGTKADKYPLTSLADVPKGGWTDEYKTEKLVLRKLEPGTFVMGSPNDELGRRGDETQHEVTLTQAFYIGVFEVTQKQWEQVMGDWPSYFNNSKCRDERPVENVSYNDIRGAVNGANWPDTNSVDAASFMGRLRARTGKMFDLPTEAQWEYACRAGTDTALNTGKNLTDKDICPNMAEAGRYKANSRNGDKSGDTSVATAKAGSYPPNAWGLYDMHGNVWEWCLDWLGKYPGTESDPKGVATGSNRVGRGGSWSSRGAYDCRAADRFNRNPSSRALYIGFRAILTLP